MSPTVVAGIVENNMKLSNHEIWQTLKEFPIHNNQGYVSTWRLNYRLSEKYPDKLINTETLRNRLKAMEKKANVRMIKDSANTLVWKAI